MSRTPRRRDPGGTGHQMTPLTPPLNGHGHRGHNGPGRGQGRDPDLAPHTSDRPQGHGHILGPDPQPPNTMPSESKAGPRNQVWAAAAAAAAIVGRINGQTTNSSPITRNSRTNTTDDGQTLKVTKRSREDVERVCKSFLLLPTKPPLEKKKNGRIEAETARGSPSRCDGCPVG